MDQALTAMLEFGEDHGAKACADLEAGFAG
jgi:hypothetical protein